MRLWGHPDSNWGNYLVRVAYLTAIWCPRNILTHLSIIAIWSAQLILRPRILSNCKSLGYCTTYTSSFLTFTITRRCNSTTHKSMSYSVLVKIFCTENGTRTHTHLTVHQILSLRRLPIPPSRHLLFQYVKELVLLYRLELNQRWQRLGATYHLFSFHALYLQSIKDSSVQLLFLHIKYR